MAGEGGWVRHVRERHGEDGKAGKVGTGAAGPGAETRHGRIGTDGAVRRALAATGWTGLDRHEWQARCEAER